MSIMSTGNHGPWRNPGEHRRPAVVVRHGEHGAFELALSPGAGVPDLVAAAGTLPPRVFYAGHRPAAPGGVGTVLVFEPPPAEPARVLPAPRPAGGGPTPAATTRVPDVVPVWPGWAPDADAAQAGATPAEVDEASAVSRLRRHPACAGGSWCTGWHPAAPSCWCRQPGWTAGGGQPADGGTSVRGAGRHPHTCPVCRPAAAGASLERRSDTTAAHQPGTTGIGIRRGTVA